MNCQTCGTESMYLLNGNCFDCGQRLDYIIYPIDFNYQCPDCQGKFNEPHIIPESPNIKAEYHCPFCGLVMKGIM